MTNARLASGAREMAAAVPFALFPTGSLHFRLVPLTVREVSDRTLPHLGGPKERALSMT